MGAPNCNPHLNISELHLQYFRVLPVKYNYMYGASTLEKSGKFTDIWFFFPTHPLEN